MSSVTYTGTCLRPSYTAIVCPMKLGKIVERRDHVLITLFLLLSLFASTLFMRCLSTKGPFLRLRAIYAPPSNNACGFIIRTLWLLYFLRFLTISLSERFLPRRVFLPRVGLPQGDIGDGRPIGARPSPPPCG